MTHLIAAIIVSVIAVAASGAGIAWWMFEIQCQRIDRDYRDGLDNYRKTLEECRVNARGRKAKGEQQ